MLNKKLIILIPAFNEEKSIANLIKSVPKLDILKQEIIVINDGSLDHTSLIAEKAGAKVITHQKNLGLGETFKTGLRYCIKNSADFIILLDGDGQYDPNKIHSLILSILENKSDLVIGNRFKYKTTNEISFIKKLGNKFLSIFVCKILLNLKKVYDIQCSFRAFNKKLGKFLNNNLSCKYNYAQEMFILAKLFDFNVKDIPTNCYRRNDGKSRLIKNPLIHIFRILWISFRTYFKIKLKKY
ncbi:MAG: glycosyltransferase family 2 protein [Candidatus Hodarchaeota archaeon]